MARSPCSVNTCPPPQEVLENLQGGYSWLHAVVLMRECMLGDVLFKCTKKQLSYIGEVFGDTAKQEIAARGDFGLSRTAKSLNKTNQWTYTDELAREFYDLRMSDSPARGRSIKKALRKNAVWWEYCDTPRVDAEGNFTIRTSDGAESVGDQVEFAFAYLWITDQLRSLAIMLLRVFFLQGCSYQAQFIHMFDCSQWLQPALCPSVHSPWPPFGKRMKPSSVRSACLRRGDARGIWG